jgi:hypothetical protein
MTKKISKVTIYYDDGTYEEIKNSIPNIQDKQYKTTTPWTPWPNVTKPYEPGPAYWKSPFVVTTTDSSAGTSYTMASTGFGAIDSSMLNKYTITSSGNGDVDLSK